MQELAQQMQEEKQRIEDMLRTLKSCPETCFGVQTWVKLTGILDIDEYESSLLFSFGSRHLPLTSFDRIGFFACNENQIYWNTRSFEPRSMTWK